MISPFYSGFPSKIKGNDIRTDFRVWLRVMQILTSEKSSFEKLIQLKYIVFKDDIPSFTVGDIPLIRDFLECGEKLSGDYDIPKEKLIDYNIDAPLIYQMFLVKYSIDLSKCDYMHYWEFMARVKEGIRGTTLADVIADRSADINELIRSGNYKPDDKHIVDLRKRKERVFLGYNAR